MNNDHKLEENMNRVYKSKSQSDIDQAYDEWAEGYDADIDTLGWCMPQLAANSLVRLLPAPAGPILDAGAGTGIVGEIIASLGYAPLSALDPSAGMLEIARKKGVYAHFYQMTLGPALDLPDSSFAAVVAVGVFTPGHAGPDGFDELVRITQPGGPIIFSIRIDNNSGIDHLCRQDKLAAQGKWCELERSEPIISFPKKHPDYRHQLFAYRCG